MARAFGNLILTLGEHPETFQKYSPLHILKNLDRDEVYPLFKDFLPQNWLILHNMNVKNIYLG
jgi:hypothetical protein